MDGYGKELHAGDTFHWNVYSDVATPGGQLTEPGVGGTPNPIPETEFAITQGSLQVTEYGNSVPYSSKLDDLSLHPVKEIIHKVLKNDAKKVFDRAAQEQFRATFLKLSPTGGTSINQIDITEAAAFPNAVSVQLGKEHVKLIVDEMKERDIEPYMGDDYFAIGRPGSYRLFKNELETIHQYTDPGLQMILFGEIGRYEGTRFVEQTNVLNGEHILPAATYYANNNASDIFFFGADTVAEAICIPEEIRGKIPTDFGRSKGIAWYFLGGYGLAHGYNAATVKQARVAWWGSLS